MTRPTSRSYAQRHSFDAAAHARVIAACQNEDRSFGDLGDDPIGATEPYASDDDADRNADRDHAMGQRQHAEAGS